MTAGLAVPWHLWSDTTTLSDSLLQRIFRLRSPKKIKILLINSKAPYTKQEFGTHDSKFVMLPPRYKYRYLRKCAVYLGLKKGNLFMYIILWWERHRGVCNNSWLELQSLFQNFILKWNSTTFHCLTSASVRPCKYLSGSKEQLAHVQNRSS